MLLHCCAQWLSAAEALVRNCTEQVYQGNITFFLSHDQIFSVCYIRANLYTYETKVANWTLYEAHRYRQCMHSSTSSKLK